MLINIQSLFAIQYFFVPLAALLGLILGSFYNVCIYRYQTGESVVFPASHCPQCGKRLRAWELIPVVSYLALRGRCSGCKASISPRYPLIEALSGILAALLAWRWGASVQFLVYLAFTGALLVASAIDWDTFILPDVITLPGSVLAIPAAVFLLGLSWQNSILGAVVGSGFFLALHLYYRRFRHKEGMGLGDAKLMFMLGGLCGLSGLPTLLIIATALGLDTMLLSRFKRKGQEPVRNIAIPFGPFLSLGAFVWMMGVPNIFGY